MAAPPTANPAEYFPLTRALLVPSVWEEPFGRVAAEAMINGIPAIVSDRGGLPEAVDALGDSAIDGGPRPYSPDNPSGGFTINSADGFVLDIHDWDEGEVFSVNWLLATSGAGYNPISNPLGPIGTADIGSLFSFGVMSLVRIAPSIGAPAGNLPGPAFVDGVGFDQSNFSFYDTVYEIPNPAEFAAKFGGASTAPFANPADNVFNVPITTALVPEPSGAILLVGAVACGSLMSRRLIVCR